MKRIYAALLVAAALVAPSVAQAAPPLTAVAYRDLDSSLTECRLYAELVLRLDDFTISNSDEAIVWGTRDQDTAGIWCLPDKHVVFLIASGSDDATRIVDELANAF